ncbi:MAG TPA: metallophosphoesterase [Candidatus Lokiarchaeia archaeon]|nr:metallophosphoesterase [Candidatus Lokiarchaeia archaeon]
MIFFTADCHLGHTNIIKYCNRPFDTVEQMDETIIANWELVITSSDTVYFLGDFCFGGPQVSILADLPFEHMVFVEGNHDPMSKLKALKDPRVEFCKETTIELEGREFFLTHNPMDASDELPNICGHVHENWTFLRAGEYCTEKNSKMMVVKRRLKQPVLNVGVDRHNFRPISAEDVLQYFNQ